MTLFLHSFRRRGARRLAARATALLAAALALALLGSATASAAAPTVAGASVQSKTAVKVLFTTPVTSASAQATSAYAVSPALTVSAAKLTDGGRSALLTTASQKNGVTYTVTVSGVVATDGTRMSGPSRGTFIGTALGANSATSAKDDFNRPSGFITSDQPFPGPWLSKDVDSKNSIALVSSPTFGGGTWSCIG